MLSKLLKYDLRANLKIFLFVWPAMILLAIATRIVIDTDISGLAGESLTVLAVMLFIMVLLAANIFALVLAVIRFYAGLFGKEGYLMFTLPVKPWQLLTSKFLSAVLFMGITLGLSVLAGFYQLLGVEGYKEIIKAIWTTLDLPTGTTLILALSFGVLSVCLMVLQVYFAASMGHLFRRKRLLWSILIWYGINVIMSILQNIALFLPADIYSALFGSISAINTTLGVLIVLQCLLGATYFFVSERILSKRLNLE